MCVHLPLFSVFWRYGLVGCRFSWNQLIMTIGSLYDESYLDHTSIVLWPVDRWSHQFIRMWAAFFPSCDPLLGLARVTTSLLSNVRAYYIMCHWNLASLGRGPKMKHPNQLWSRLGAWIPRKIPNSRRVPKMSAPKGLAESNQRPKAKDKRRGGREPYQVLDIPRSLRI